MNIKTEWIFSTYTGQGKPTAICFVQQLLTQSECFSKLYWLIFPSNTWWSLEPESWTAALLGYFSYPTSAALNYRVVLPSILAHHSIFLLSVCVLCCSSQSLSHSINKGRICLWEPLAPPCVFPKPLCGCLDKEGHGVCPRQHWTCCSYSPNDNDSLLHALTGTSLCLEQNSQQKEIGQCLWLMEQSTEPLGCQPAVARAQGFYNASLWLDLYLLGVWLTMLERSLLWSTALCLNIQMVSDPEACWIMAARSEIQCL